MVEVVILSGKGGTGKTSLTAAFAHLAGNAVICDLDVDAPDLHLLLQPRQLISEPFVSGHNAQIQPDRCDGCGLCQSLCRFNAIADIDGLYHIDPLHCEGCKTCVIFCPNQAIDFTPKQCGQWYQSSTRMGPLVHAQLFPAEENSGRLVALLRQKAKSLAIERQLPLILSDGPPGIGCPVISSLAGASLAIIVSEPTPSGEHDLLRVVELCDHFKVPVGVIINKADLSAAYHRRIEAFCDAKAIPMLGSLPYDPIFIEAVVQGRAITEHLQGGVELEVRRIWSEIEQLAKIRLAA